MTRDRNYSLDLLKFILAFLIVLHHTPSHFHDILQPITTCAVPTFFMVSGFLLIGRDGVFTPQRTMKNAVRITKIFCWALVIFYIWNWIRHGEPYIPSSKDIFLLVFANNEPVAGHLWYLMAYAYALLIITLLARNGNTQGLKRLAVVSLTLYFVFDIWHIYCNVPKYLTLVYCFRNFFFTAIPMIFIGTLISRCDSLKPRAIIALIVISSMGALVEMNIFYVNHIADVYFFTIPLSCLMVLLFLNCKISKPNMLTRCGEMYGLYVYILHPIVIKLLIDQLGSENYYVGITAFFITLAVSALLVFTKDKLIKTVIK